jgi:hypothetical protein
MTTREFERRLQHCNPGLYIKKYGTDKVGIHLGTKFILRLMPGDITPYNKFVYKTTMHDQAKSDFNPKGYIKMKFIVGRGRMEAARILYTSRHIKLSDVAYLSK